MATINRKASSEPCVELLVLLDMTEDLCNALPINDLLPSLISHHVIDFKDKAEICVNKPEHHRVSYFLEKHLNNPLQLKPPHTAPFYQFLKVMQRSPKCGFLVERIQRRMEEYEAQASSEDQSSSSPPCPPVPAPARTTATTTVTTNTAMTPAAATRITGRGDTTPPVNVPQSTISFDSPLVSEDPNRIRRLMHTCVIPKIYEEWEAVAAFLDYSINAKNKIKATYRTPKDCCKALLEDWVTTDNGAKPKTWRRLIEALSEIEELEPVMDYIKQKLMSEGVTFESYPVENSHNYSEEVEEQSTARGGGADTQEHYHGQDYYDHHREDQTAPQHYEHSSLPGNQIRRNEQYRLDSYSSYDPQHTPAHHYGYQAPVTTNPVPPTYNTQLHGAPHDHYHPPMVDNQAPMAGYQVPPGNQAPHGYQVPLGNQAPHGYQAPHPDYSTFILYSKEEEDPEGNQVLCLSDILHNCGIRCDLDLYHLNDEINDWSFWIAKSIHHHTASHYSHVILVCSPTMISTLEERNDNAKIKMVAGSIDRLTLRHYLQQGAQKVLPLFINEPSDKCVPPSLSEKTRYYFPYDRLNEMPEDVTTQQVINHPDFTSLRSLVATLTGQKEFPEPGLGPVPSFRGSYNTTAGVPYDMFTGNATAKEQQQGHGPGDDNTATSTRTTAQQLPATVTLRTGEQPQHDVPRGGQVAFHQPPLPAGVGPYSRLTRGQRQAHRPTTGNTPELVRHDPGLQPSSNYPDVPPPYDIATSHTVSAQTVTLRIGEQAQHDVPHGEQVAFKQPLPAEMNLYSGQARGKQPALKPELFRHDLDLQPSTNDPDVPPAPPSYDDSIATNYTAPLMSAQGETPRTGELALHDKPHDEKVSFHQQLSPASMVSYYRQPMKTQARRPPVGNSPKLLRRELDQHSATNQDSIPHGDISVRSLVPQSVVERTLEQQYDMPHVRTQGPTGNTPKFLRHQQPSTPNQDSISCGDISVRSLEPLSVVERTLEQQYDTPRGEPVMQSAAAGSVFHSRQSTDVQSSLNTMAPQEELNLFKRDREPSSDTDSYYSTPNQSPRDNSLGMMDSTVKSPAQATPSMSQSGGMVSEVAQPTDQEDASYKTAYRQNNLSS